MAKARTAKQQQTQKSHGSTSGNRDTVFGNLKDFAPLTENQAIARNDFEDGKNLLLTGYAGTGKTYIALHLGLQAIHSGDQKHIGIYRSAVASRDIGFLPGTEEEKMAVYEPPYRAIVNQILGRSDAYDILKTKGLIKFESTSFLRGKTFDNTYIVIDEAQNLDDGEINTVMTRIGKNTRVAICGDIRQTDLAYHKSGIAFLQKALKRMPKYFSIVEMEADDIVRSGIVKDWILAVEAIKEDEN
jgi:phosphate starvation-inducible PhoH-like protein